MSEVVAPLAVESSFAFLRERARLASSGRALGPAELADWGELCLMAGLRDEARLLFRVSAICAGLSRQILDEQRALGERTGLWTAEGTTLSPRPQVSGVIELAIQELRAFAGALVGEKEQEPDEREPTPAASQGAADAEATQPMRAVRSVSPSAGMDPQAHAVKPAPAEDDDPLAGNLMISADALFAHLLGKPGAASAALDAVLASLLAAAEAVPALDEQSFASSSLPVLASAIAFRCLKDFILEVRDLFAAPQGSAELFHRAARFDSAGLGPYFGNVQQIARKSRDVFELAFDAAEAAGQDLADETVIAPWIVLLSRRLSGPLLNEVIDDLGDKQMGDALNGMLSRLLQVPRHRVDATLVMRIRDAALDNLDYPLASRAQRAITDLFPDRVLEWEILGSIDASAGRIMAAEESFARALAIEPEHRGVTERMTALRNGAFAPFAITVGFGSPENRRLTRLRRRTGKAAPKVVERTSAIAVQVNY